MLPYLALLAAVAIWGGNWIVGRALQGQVPPVALSFWRWVIAAAIFLPFVIRPLWRQRAVVRREWRRLLVLALVGIACFNALIYYGLESTTAINGALVNSASPIFVIVISWCGLGDRSHWRQAVGVVVSLFGVSVILSRGEPSALMALRFGAGDLVITGAIFLWALYTILLRHWPSRLTPLNFVGATMMCGLAVLAPAYLVERSFVGGFEVTRSAMVGIVYLAVFVSIIGYLCWNFGVRAAGAAQASLFLHLVPAFAAAAAMVLLDETLHLFHLVGLLFILSGIYIANASRPIWSRREGGTGGGS